MALDHRSQSGALPAVEVRPGRGPVLLSVPHSGRDYPRSVLARSRLGQSSLERLEDPLVDQLVQGAIDRGVGAVIARTPRALIDVNRAIDELHPAAIRGRSGDAPTARARAGLGLIPTRLNGVGELWREAIAEAEQGMALERKLGLRNAYLPFIFARIYVLANRPDSAIDQLEETIRRRDFYSRDWLRIDTTFAPLRTNPQFQRLISSVPPS